MADPHVILAPIVEPTLPPVQEVAPPPVALLPLVLIAALFMATAGAAFGWWRRTVPVRALRRIARSREVTQGAQELARWQQRHWPAAAPHWRQALDRLRFGPAEEAAAATLQRLCAEAQQALAAGRGQ